jgi:hypothetical protein
VGRNSLTEIITMIPLVLETFVILVSGNFSCSPKAEEPSFSMNQSLISVVLGTKMSLSKDTSVGL